MKLQQTIFLLFGVICSCAAQNSSTYQIPLSYLRSRGIIADMKNPQAIIDRFFNDFKVDGVSTNVPINTNGSTVKVLGSGSVTDFERSELAATVSHAGCDPYDQIVPIPNDRTNVLMYPSCVQLKQCGGCCGHPSLACKPTAKKEKIVQILKYVYDGSQAHPVEKIDYAQLEEHTACECQCKITESDCNPALHVFDDWDCKCACKNGRQNCGTNKRWDDDLCACRCAVIQNCGTGYRYNMADCRCEIDPARSGGPVVGPATVAQPDQPTVQAVTTNPCSHLSCPPPYYKPTLKHGGTCVCKFDRQLYLASLNN